MKYELPSTELIVIEENNYLKFGEYLNDMQCDDTVNKLNLDDLEYVKKLQQENKQLKSNWNMLKEHLKNRYDNGTESISYRQVFMEIREAMQALEMQQKLEQGSDSNE